MFFLAMTEIDSKHANFIGFYKYRKRKLCNRANKTKLECGPMPNVMAALPNIGGALCLRPQSLADAITRVPCTNAANIGERKTWTQSEFCTEQNSVTGQGPPKMYI